MDKNMRTACVITSINDPHKTSVIQWAAMFEKLFLVVDEKTPEFVEDIPNVEVISVYGARKDGKKDWLPRNHYARKMYGYLAAYDQGFDQVFETDDDNYPTGITQYDTHGEPDEFANEAYFDLYSYMGISPAIQRGLPFHAVGCTSTMDRLEAELPVSVTMFWCDGEPDSWAVERLCRGDAPLPSAKPKPSVGLFERYTPLNTQMTLVDLRLILGMYLPVDCFPRMSDILRGWRLQQEAYDIGTLLCLDCTRRVYQKRNPHDLVEDLREEWPLMVNPIEFHNSARDRYYAKWVEEVNLIKEKRNEG